MTPVLRPRPLLASRRVRSWAADALRPRARALLVLAWAAVTLAGPTLAAGPKTQSLAASTSVVASCVIQSTNSINLGTYVPASGAALTGSGQISLKCTKGDAVAVVPTAGGTTMTGSKGSLSYGLYTSSSYAQVWGGPTFSYETLNFSTTTLYYFAHDQNNTSMAQCIALSGGTMAEWQSSAVSSSFGAGNCAWSLMTGSTNGWAAYGDLGNKSLYNTTTGTYAITTGGNYQMILASSTTNTSGSNWSIPVGTAGGGLSITGTSASVATPLVFTYYAKVPASQDVPAGAYTDTVTVQVAF